jgi:hypothetical protein
MSTNPHAPARQPSAKSSDQRGAAKRLRGPYRQQLTAPGAGKAGITAEAKRTAALILEVLAGVRTPAAAASALGIRLPRYYLWEQRAIQGLILACQPRPRGRTVSADRRLSQLERELAVSRRELARHQALARTTQRALGLAPAAAHTPAPASKAPGAVGGKRTRRRKPSVRALRAARFLGAANSSGEDAQGTVQKAVEGIDALGSAGGGIRPTAMESVRSPAQADHGGTSHGGGPKAVEHLASG